MNPVWLFDLDDTLHDASAHIFPHINQAMTDYVGRLLQVDAVEANRLRQHYWRRYGATLLGLMRHHGVDPHHFLHHTHQFPDLPRMVVHDRALRSLLRRLPGRKVVFSNGPRAYAHAVIGLLGIRPLLDDVICIEDVDFAPKPMPQAYRIVLRKLGVPASRCIMVEDSVANLLTAKRLGMRTVLVAHRAGCPPQADLCIPHILKLSRSKIAS